ncbi:MarR family transcriptional regulator [Microbacteriaceae bacterium VKM Ac-2855]|nr:MarR family transcriptional regulator [Microbacteriaceae bacterium VKM Ac-2855]
MNYPEGQRPDAVDDIRDRWAQLRPELDLAPIPLIGRILRASALIVRSSDEVLARHALTRGEFDILTALRRSDAPQSPGTLRTIGLATGPATTKRLRSLEQRGLIARSANPADGRGALIALTADGAELVDRVFPDVLGIERELLARIPDSERAATADALRTLLASVEARADAASPSERRLP